MTWLKIAVLMVPLSLMADPHVRTRVFKPEVPLTGEMRAIASDAAGNIFAAGNVGSGLILVTKTTPDFEQVFLAEIPADMAVQVNALALDPDGNIWITGATTSPTFSVTEDAYRRSFGCQGVCPSDAFLMKLDGNSGAVLYATYLGGTAADAGTAVGIGSDGAVYVAGTTASGDFPVSESAPVAKLPSAPAGFVARFSSDGKRLTASTFVNGAPAALALDASGVYITGQTNDPQPGTEGAFQRETRMVSLISSGDGGATWTNLAVPARVLWLEPDPGTAGLLYAGTMAGLYRSRDDGVSWEDMGEPFSAAIVRQVRIDRGTPAVTYVIAGTEPLIPPASSRPDALWKSTDGGQSWQRVSRALNSSLQLHPGNPSTLYLTASDNGSTSISRDGGLTWESARVTYPRGLAVAATNGDELYIGSSNALRLMASRDAGKTWAMISDPFATRPPYSATPLFASGTTLLYASTALSARAGGIISGNGMRRSQDGGVTWSTVDLDVTASSAFGDPRDAQRIYVTGPGGLYTSADAGSTWTSLRAGMDNPNVTQLSVGASGRLYAAATPQSGAFLLKLDAALANIAFCTAYGGSGGTNPKAIALDAEGRPIVVGLTLSRDFPVTAGAPAGFQDGFIARFSADGTQLEFGTLLGGTGNDSANAVALGSNGTTWVAGQTISRDYPVTSGAFQTEMRGSNSNGLITALAADGKIEYSTLLGGSWWDRLNAIALRGSKVYVAASVGSTDFPGGGASAQSGLPAAALVEVDLGRSDSN